MKINVHTDCREVPVETPVVVMGLLAPVIAKKTKSGTWYATLPNKRMEKMDATFLKGCGTFTFTADTAVPNDWDEVIVVDQFNRMWYGFNYVSKIYAITLDQVGQPSYHEKYLVVVDWSTIKKYMIVTLDETAPEEK